MDQKTILMKHKRLFIALLASAFFIANGAKAQSLEQKLRAQVQQQKQRQEAVLRKAREQDQQRAAETRPTPPVVHPAGENNGNNPQQSGEPLSRRAAAAPAVPATEPKTGPLPAAKKHEKKQQ